MASELTRDERDDGDPLARKRLEAAQREIAWLSPHMSRAAVETISAALRSAMPVEPETTDERIRTWRECENYGD